ncbi:helix-turn-helix domain-containing protein [Chloroflexota bacterium]
MSELESGSNDKGGGGRGIARPRPINDNKLCYTVPEVAQMLGFSRNFGYELVRRGELPTLKFGKRILITRAALEKMLAKDE